jgi:alpha-tubulin suppressor-like RCC1 family protein
MEQKRALPRNVFAVLAAAAMLTAGVAPALASSGGTAEHWGAFIGDGTQIDENTTPVAISLPFPVAQVSSSNDAQYALLNNGEVYAWGDGGDGELGDGGTVNSYTTAVQVQFPAGVKIAFLPTDVMPYDSAFAVDTTGRVWGWGLNQGSEFCTGKATEHTTPFELPATLSKVTTLAGAADHATYDAGGTLYSCGTNQYGELGTGTTTSSKTPVKVTGIDDADVTALVASFGDTGALLTDGDYYDWGENNHGQIGNGTTVNADAPVQVSLPAAVTQAAQGGSAAINGQTLVKLSSGAVYAWGDDSTYQLGDGKTATEESPEQISPPAGVTYQTLASGGNTSYAIAVNGDVYAWGDSKVGQVGNGTTTTAKKPVMVSTGQSLISSTSTDVVTAPAT